MSGYLISKVLTGSLVPVEMLPVFHHPCGTREVRHPWMIPHTCALCDAIYATKANIVACFDTSTKIPAKLRRPA